MLEDNIGRRIVAGCISDAYELGVREILEHGVLLQTGRGTAFGSKALTLTGFNICVIDPLGEPSVSNLSPNSRGYCHNYALEYCILDNQKPGEEYTYSGRAHKNDQIKKAIEKLKENSWLRDIIIQIANERSIDLESPECLRMVGVRQIRDGEFYGHATLRSWDFFGAANANMYGFTQLCNYILTEANPDFRLSWMHFFGIDTHIYEKQLDGSHGVRETFKAGSVYLKPKAEEPIKTI